MSLLNTGVYDAFVSAGTEEAKARQAAVAIHSDAVETKGAIAKLSNQMELLKLQLENFKNHIEEKFDAKMEKVNWMFGTLMTLCLAILVKLFMK